MSRITVGTFNTLKDLSAQEFREDLWKLLHTTPVDLVGLQEVHGPGRTAALAAQDGWGVWRPGQVGPQQQTPVLWRDSMYEYVGAGTEKYASGGLTLPDRWANWVELVHKPSQRTVFLLNSHAHPHIERNGRPTNLPRTTEAFKHFDNIVKTARYLGTQGEVFVTGDFNVDYRADRRVRHPQFPYVTLGNAHLVPCWRWTNTLPTGTHKKGNRIIDYVAHRRSNNVGTVHTKALTDYRSDHRPILATYTIN